MGWETLYNLILFVHYDSPLCVVEPVHGEYLRLDPLGPLHLGLGLLCQPPLLLVVVKDGAHVLPAAVRPGVVVLPKYVQQIGVGCHLKRERIFRKRDIIHQRVYSVIHPICLDVLLWLSASVARIQPT